MNSPRRIGVPCCLEQDLRLTTRGAGVFHDITDEIVGFVGDASIQSGVVLAHSLHTTAGLVVNESETGLHADFVKVANELIPRGHSYLHDDLSIRTENLCPEDAEAPNGHAHLQHVAFAVASVVLPIRDGQLVLGQWQRVMLVELDRARERTVVLQVIGIAGDRQGHELQLSPADSVGTSTPYA
jgi:secondary thiamine-phosphate synthase enzyme